MPYGADERTPTRAALVLWRGTVGESPFVIKKASACSPYGADERTPTRAALVLWRGTVGESPFVIKKSERMLALWCGRKDSNLHAEAQEPKSCVSASSTTSAYITKGRSSDLPFCGDPTGTRTRVTAVKGRCLNRLTMGP